jgi:thioredoxin 1
MRGDPPTRILSAAALRLSGGFSQKTEGLQFYETDSNTMHSVKQKQATQERSLYMSIKAVSDQTFEQEVLGSELPVLVDYWAEWCGPCKMIAPILDEVSKDYEGKLQIAKLNVDENRDVPAKFGIRGIPTLMLFKNGALAATKVGALSKSQLTLFLDSNL